MKGTEEQFYKIIPAVPANREQPGMLAELRLWLYSEPVWVTSFVSGWGFWAGFNAG